MKYLKRAINIMRTCKNTENHTFKEFLLHGFGVQNSTLYLKHSGHYVALEEKKKIVFFFKAKVLNISIYFQ